jgi:hypothetical protein
LSNAIMTVLAIAAAAAITAGLLVLAGVGDEETPEERIARVSQELAGSILEKSPDLCDGLQPVGWTGYTRLSEMVLIDEDSLANWQLSEVEARAVSARLMGELREQCEARDR